MLPQSMITTLHYTIAYENQLHLHSYTQDNNSENFATLLCPGAGQREGTGSTPTVIRHGDSTALNFMFKVNEHSTESSSAKLLDYQNCSLGNGLQDLMLLLYTSCTPSYRREHLEETVTIYVECFNKLAADFGARARKLLQISSLCQHHGQFDVQLEITFFFFC
jgi:hypothetical protein